MPDRVAADVKEPSTDVRCPGPQQQVGVHEQEFERYKALLFAIAYEASTQRLTRPSA